MAKQQIVTWIVMATLVWFGLSWYWYTCGIKGFCYQNPSAPVANVVDRDDSGVRGSVSRSNNTPSSKQTVTSTEEITISCDSYLDSFIRLGSANVRADVVRLQEFLNEYEGESLPVDGVYSSEDVAAVNRFQEKYRAQVLSPFGIENPTGYVFRSTRAQINSLQCAFEYAKNNN